MERERFRTNKLIVAGILALLPAGGACAGKAPASAAVSAKECSWPAAFDPGDAMAGQCRAAHHYLVCEGSNGGGMSCLSNDPAACPVPNATPGVTYSNCTNMCKSGEYALACGGVGPGPWPEPPAACRTLPPSPGGGSVSCCPCGS